MKFSTQIRQLLQIVKLLKTIVPDKTNQPSVSNLLLRKKKGEVYLTATDGTTFITTPIPIGEADKHDGVVMVPCEVLAALVDSLQDQEILTMETDDEVLTVSWENGSARIPIFDAKDWPADIPTDKDNPGFNEMKLPASAFMDALEHTIDATTNVDASRPMLDTILFEFFEGGGGMAVGTDTRIIATYPLPEGPGRNVRVQLPARPAKVFSYLVKSVTKETKKASKENAKADKDGKEVKETTAPDTDIFIAADNRRIRLLTGAFEMRTSVTANKFPAYEKIIPKMSDTPFTIKREDLLSSLKRSCAAVGMKHPKIIFEFNGCTVKTSVKSDITMSTVNENLQFCDYAGNPLTIAFNCESLICLLSQFNCDEVRFDFTGERKPVLITSTNPEIEPFQAVIASVPAN